MWCNRSADLAVQWPAYVGRGAAKGMIWEVMPYKHIWEREIAYKTAYSKGIIFVEDSNPVCFDFKTT